MIRWLLLLFMFGAVILSYSLGSSLGMMVFLVVAFAIEAAFWFGLFTATKSKK